VKKRKINDMGGTGQKYKIKYDGQTVQLTAHNEYFRDRVDIPIGIFCELALEVQQDYMQGNLDES
jgi:hypothetical protein